jgi:hypothetical protein
LKAKVTISRTSQDKVVISIVDDASRLQFVEVSMEPEAFAYAITGLAYRPADIEVRGLEFVGKTHVREQRTIECPLNTHDKSTLRKWLEDNAQEEGWLLDTYLGSQTSITRGDGKTILRYAVDKYV